MKALKLKESGAEKSRQVKKLLPSGGITALLDEISDKAKKDAVAIVQMRPSKEIALKEQKPGMVPAFSAISVNLEM